MNIAITDSETWPIWKPAKVSEYEFHLYELYTCQISELKCQNHRYKSQNSNLKNTD